MSYWSFILVFAGPFIAVGALYLLWAYITMKLQYRFPRLYEFAQKTHDQLPKLMGLAVIVIFILLLFTSDYYYDD